MAIKNLDESTVTQPDIRAEWNRDAINRSRGVTRASLAELADLVEQALAKADALGLSLVGIDLCTALERLKAMDRPVLPFVPRNDT